MTGWESLTWKETGDRVTRLAAGLVALGIEPEQRVGIASGTRLEWILADLAIMCAGRCHHDGVPVHEGARTSAYILADSECRVVFAEDDAQIAKLTDRKAELPHLQQGGDLRRHHRRRLGDLDGRPRAARRRATSPSRPDVVEERIAATGPDALATLIYTSGTTGRPKGVRLRHSSWTYEGAAIQAQDILDENDLQFLWLPMAHSFGKVLLSTQLACGFATAVDGRVDKIVDNLAVVRPTFMGAAPRIFEKAYARIITMQAAEGGVKEKIFNQAFKVGLEVDRRKREGRPVPFLLARQHALFDKLVFSKVRARFGGRVRFFISGAAALNQEIAEWFHAAGILILEGYGLTESSAGSFVNHPDDYRFGTRRPGLPRHRGQDRRGRRDPDQGPGRHGGLPQPARGDRRGADRGRLAAHRRHRRASTREGFLRITDRKKDLFKTSGGKYIAPSAIESQFKAICPYASQFLVHGAERNFWSP